jgi:hypothetical protein
LGLYAVGDEIDPFAPLSPADFYGYQTFFANHFLLDNDGGLRDLLNASANYYLGVPEQFVPCRDLPKSETFEVGAGELYPNVRVMSFNGVFCTMIDALRNATLLSDMFGGCRVQGVLYPTRGGISDLAGLFGFERENDQRTIRQMAMLVYNTVWERGRDGVPNFVYLFGHSKGGYLIGEMLSYLDDETKKYLDVTTFGTARLVVDPLLAGSTNYISTNDPVPYLGMARSLFAGDVDFKNANVEYIRPTKPCFIEHSFANSSYRKALEKKAREIKSQTKGF